MAISRLHAWCVSGLWVVPNALVAGGCLLTWLCARGQVSVFIVVNLCATEKFILLFIFVVEIVSTLGEGTFGKVVCCKDR